MGYTLLSLTNGNTSATSANQGVSDGGYSSEATPVPIPNTAVKLVCADGTAWATVWESRSPPSLTPFWVLGTGYWVLGTGYWVLGTGYWVLGTGYWRLEELQTNVRPITLFPTNKHK